MDDKHTELRVLRSQDLTKTYQKVNLELNKVYNMDCLEGMKMLEDNSVDLIVTSPPYNIGIDYGGYDDDKEFEEYEKFMLKVLKECIRVTKDKGIIAFNIGNQRNTGLPHYFYFLLKKAGLCVFKEIFWYKGLYYIQGETIFLCSKTGEYNHYYKRNDGFYSNGQFATVWEMRYKNSESKKKLGHNAFFVKQLPRNLILINTKLGDTVLDPFMGVGTTALASKELNRKYIGFEINQDYVDVCNKRLSQRGLSDYE